MSESYAPFAVTLWVINYYMNNLPFKIKEPIMKKWFEHYMV